MFLVESTLWHSKPVPALAGPILIHPSVRRVPSSLDRPATHCIGNDLTLAVLGARISVF
jgi:hypothetical protein